MTLLTKIPSNRWSVEQTFNWPLRMFLFLLLYLVSGTRRKARAEKTIPRTSACYWYRKKRMLIRGRRVEKSKFRKTI